MKYKIKFRSTEDIRNFVLEVSGFKADVNLYVGHQEFDAKSIIALMSLSLYRVYEVQLMDSSRLAQTTFQKVISRFEVSDGATTL